MALELDPLCVVDIVLGDTVWVGDGPAGTRVVAEVGSATVTGERLNGTLAGAAADWLVVNGTVGTVDVRGTIRTDDDAVIFVQYRGRMDVADGFGSVPFHVAPVFETSDERYAWLNAVQAIGVGTTDGQSVRYEWYAPRT
jgi:hypothetical protein